MVKPPNKNINYKNRSGSDARGGFFSNEEQVASSEVKSKSWVLAR
jgi:hypothetical protein